jgi:hypothetical protein
MMGERQVYQEALFYEFSPASRRSRSQLDLKADLTSLLLHSRGSAQRLSLGGRGRSLSG